MIMSILMPMSTPTIMTTCIGMAIWRTRIHTRTRTPMIMPTRTIMTPRTITPRAMTMSMIRSVTARTIIGTKSIAG